MTLWIIAWTWKIGTVWTLPPPSKGGLTHNNQNWDKVISRTWLDPPKIFQGSSFFTSPLFSMNVTPPSPFPSPSPPLLTIPKFYIISLQVLLYALISILNLLNIWINFIYITSLISTTVYGNKKRWYHSATFQFLVI